MRDLDRRMEAVRTSHVWATTEVVGKNTIRQLLVPAHDGLDYTDDGRQYVHSRFGCWPAASGPDEANADRKSVV